MREVAIRLDERRSQEFRRLLGASLVLHLVVGLALLFSPSGPSVAPPLGIRVQLVAPPSAAPKPAPAAPKPAPARPKPKPPKPAPVVLPTEASTPKPEPKVEPEPEPKPKPPEPKVEEKPPEPVAQPPQQVEEFDIADLREELGEPAPEAAPGPVLAQVGPIGSPDGSPVSPEVAAWLRAAQAHVWRNNVVPPNFEMLSLVTVVSIDLDAAGNVRGEPSVESGSGNPWYDKAVVRSIQKASPMPAPPKAGRWRFELHSDRD